MAFRMHLRKGGLSYITDSRMDFLLADNNYTLPRLKILITAKGRAEL